ncbi:rifamycin-inactivating phosphotransferase RphC [Dyadobacter sp. CECT 9623]|uniref:Rifamycin-inactivating phosphotransferase RphC n=1 Tax=Dyadobacter linearis TaxID=2823330 RepID=A0ABM8UJ89_9BACT|nr:phosphoenolpyruvate synthase [Dyadobacter sp. CECT 9623]CAG5067569.1 rifamycin-inactivating phosphotransferase RphC [Dyadobacter sp. CECT 9623]
MADVNSYIIGFPNINKNQIQAVGGKGVNLGELSRLSGLLVPDGFCITTRAYQEILGKNETLHTLLDQLADLKAEDRKEISEAAAQIREVIESIPVPESIENEIVSRIEKLGATGSYAVRSSATAEDLPTASFAGQQDTYLNISGKTAILEHISKCWASLFTDRAVVYRLQNGFDHREVSLSVIIQKMILPDVAGIMFTADPVNGNRKVVSIDASFGLGEALVSGIVNADNFKIRAGKLFETNISIKKCGIFAVPEGGTEERELPGEKQSAPSLSDAQVLELASLGRKIEAHFGRPQDIEWCLADNAFYILQSRPVTTLFPVPQASDSGNRVYVSVGHQQMMTDAMKPLGLSFFMLTTRAPMRHAGGRLFVDITNMLGTSAGRSGVINNLGKSDPLIKDALLSLIARGDFLAPLSDESDVPASHFTEQIVPQGVPANLVTDLIKENRASVYKLKRDIQSKSGADLFVFLLEDLIELKQQLFGQKNIEAITIGMNAVSWVNEKMMDWLGEKNAADTLSQSVPNNITSEMGMELLDVADVARQYPEVLTFFQHAKIENLTEELARLEGGNETLAAIEVYLEKYGMRCAGEIDITKSRWSEHPAILVPLILNNIRNTESGASKRKFEQGRQQALSKEQELLSRLELLPGGEQKAAETKRMIGLIRDFSGYREYPKYGLVNRYFVYKKAILKEAEKLRSAALIRDIEDVYYLTFEELREVVVKRAIDLELINRRKEDFKTHEKLSPPRVITSDGEIITGTYRRENLPPGAIAGLAVSSGTIEGRARVILQMQDSQIEDGDILVTTFTDPSWTPLFVSVKGLVTEVGGLMTHGAVIAREYGLPAIVGVENATKLIKDGQRIRVNGTDGFVEILTL